MSESVFWSSLASLHILKSLYHKNKEERAVMKPLNHFFGDYLDYCAQALWGRWDMSLLWLCLLFAVATGLTYAGRVNNILFGELDVWSILITALVVTAATSLLALARKHKRI